MTRSLRAPFAAAAAVLTALAGGSCQSDYVPPARSAQTTTTPAASASVTRGTVRGIAGEPDIVVRLIAGTNSATMSSLARMVWVAPLGGSRPAARMVAPVSAQLTPAGWELVDSTGLTARFDRQAPVAVAGEEGVLGPVTNETAANSPTAPVLGRTANAGYARPAQTSSAVVVVNGKSYPGLITLVARSDGSASSFDVLDSLPMEDYLKCVVASEMLAGWPLAAYQAQAVAARSYALSERARARAAGSNFDVEASTKDQVFASGTENPLASKAVADTRGVVISWNGQPLRAYFSSTCGGRPASARDTWPITRGMEFNLAGPVQGAPRDHACQAAPYYHWTVTRSRKELLDRFRAFGRASGSPLKNLTGIDSIRSAGVNGAGRTNCFLITQPGGQSHLVSGEELRRACNHEVSGLPPNTPQNRIHSSDAEIVVSNANVLFTGRGLGHGVGMCQWCAKGFAQKGETWQSILSRFYPGARPERVY